MSKSRVALIDTQTILPAVLGALASILFVALVTWAATTINDNVNTGGTLTVSGNSTLSGTTTSAGGIYASSTVFSDGIFTNTRNAVLGAASGTPTVTGLNVTGSGYLTAGLGIGKATTGAGNLLVDELAIIEGRLGVAATTSPTVELGVVGSGYFTDGVGVGYATTGTGNLLVNNLLAVNNLLNVRGAGTSTFTGRIGLVGSSTPYLEVGIAGDVAIGGAIGTSTLSVESTTVGGCIELRSSAGTWIRLYAGAGGATTTDNRVHVGPAGVGLIIGQGRCQQTD